MLDPVFKDAQRMKWGFSVLFDDVRKLQTACLVQLLLMSASVQLDGDLRLRTLTFMGRSRVLNETHNGNEYSTGF